MQGVGRLESGGYGRLADLPHAEDTDRGIVAEIEQLHVYRRQPQLGAGVVGLQPHHGRELLLHRRERFPGAAFGEIGNGLAQALVAVPMGLRAKGQQPVVEHEVSDQHETRSSGSPTRAGNRKLPRDYAGVLARQLPQTAAAGGQHHHGHHAAGHVPDEIGHRVGEIGGKSRGHGGQAEEDPAGSAAAEQGHTPADARADGRQRQQQTGYPSFQRHLDVAILRVRVFDPVIVFCAAGTSDRPRGSWQGRCRRAGSRRSPWRRLAKAPVARRYRALRSIGSRRGGWQWLS